ncbi:MAG TPA: glycosyltransferase family 4 protein [Verrucomicrobiae bacterium]|nr:glycosyltransferase family 4 protein [Verrucomicrobiae bacterium]
MRICIVNDYSIEHIGGAVSSMFEQKKALEAAGHSVTILQLGNRPKSTVFDLNGVIFIEPSFTLPRSLYDLPMLLSTPENLEKLRAILKEQRPDVIHLQSEMSLARMTQRLAKELGVPSVYTVHTFFWQYKGIVKAPTAWFLRNALELVFRQPLHLGTPEGNVVEKTLKDITLSAAEAAQAVISPSAHQRDTMLRAGLRTPCYVVSNPFASSGSVPATPVSNNPQALRILWIGRCEPEKRPLEFIEAIKLASTHTKAPFTVDFIGEGSLLDDMKQRATMQGVTFHGKKTHTDTVALIDTADITVLSSYHFDNQPMTVVESITRFRPVLYCDELLSDEIGKAGYRSDGPSPEAMAKAIVALAEDRRKVVELSRHAQKQAQLFSREHFAQKMSQIYGSIRL